MLFQKYHDRNGRRIVTLFKSIGLTKAPGSESAARICPRKSPPKRGLWESYFLQGIVGKTHTRNLQILREDTLGATCSAGPFCLLPSFGLQNFSGQFRYAEVPPQAKYRKELPQSRSLLPLIISGSIARKISHLLEKVQGATRLGAKGLRASERKSASERTSENLSKISENL